MAQQIVISPVSRIEGHAKITLHLDENGEVRDAEFHVTQFRGFEKLVEGRPFSEMPSLMARICGICPVSHAVASAKACDDLMAVRIPETAINLRRVMNHAQIVQSHALSFFYLSSPDFLLGMDSDPAKRNILGVLEHHPKLVRDGIALRKFGQQIIEWLGQKRVHPTWIIPGGVSSSLTEAMRDQILATIPAAKAIAQETLVWFKRMLNQGKFQTEIRTLGNFPSLFFGLRAPHGKLGHYSGTIRIVNADGDIIADKLDPRDYPEYIGEKVEPNSYLKSTHYTPLGYPQGMYRVGPLARLNIVDGAGTPLADEELAEFQALDRGSVLSSFHYHYARLIEILHSIEQIELLLGDPEILSKHVRAHAEPNAFEGVGASEAPRGTLMHHYRIDENGLIVWVNLIIATGHNSLAMNHGILQAAKHHVRGGELKEGMLNRVEAVIRAFDPCLSCSTHAFGQMPLRIQLVAPDGTVVQEVAR